MNLEELIESGSTVGEGLSMLRNVADALDFLHAQNLCHYDVKPENVLIFADESGLRFARLNDFSLTRSIRHEPDSYGDRVYAAPEVFDRLDVADEYRIRADVLSLAVTATTMLRGVPVPLVERSNPNARYWSNLPGAVTELFMRACSRDVLQRPTSASSFVAELCGALESVFPTHSLPLPNEVEP
jgi:serine/threonine protein kinase